MNRVTLYVVAWIIGFTTAVLLRSFLGNFALDVGFVVAFTVWAFGTETRKHAVLIVVTLLLSKGGIDFYRYVRQDAVGIGVLVVCQAIAGMILWPLFRRRRRELQQQR